MADRDYYEVLGVARDASAEEIKKAYRKLRARITPTSIRATRSAEAKFKEAQQAYDILSDAEKRSLYDRFGKAAFEGMAAAGRARAPPSGPRHQAGAGSFTFDFGEFFGQQAGGPPGAGCSRGGRHGAGASSRNCSAGSAAAAPGRTAPGRHLEAQLTIPFLTAVRGGETDDRAGPRAAPRDARRQDSPGHRVGERSSGSAARAKRARTAGPAAT